MAVWKYELEITDIQILSMPIGAVILSVGNQYGSLCLWALVNPKLVYNPIIIEIVGTGNPVAFSKTIKRKFIGTVIIGSFVWHVFERSDQS